MAQHMRGSGTNKGSTDLSKIFPVEPDRTTEDKQLEEDILSEHEEERQNQSADIEKAATAEHRRRLNLENEILNTEKQPEVKTADTMK